MPFGPTTIQPQTKLNFRNTYDEVDTAASDIRNGEIAAMNREFRVEQEQRRREYDE